MYRSSRGKMRDADMECKVAFLSFHFLLFPRFFISLVTSHEPICALLLKCFQLEGHFPTAKHEISRSVVDYVAHQLKLPSTLFNEYDWQGHTIKLHRTQIRDELGFREATTADSDSLSTWLIATQLAADQNLDHLTAKVLAELRERKIEPPTPERIGRLIRSACATYAHS